MAVAFCSAASPRPVQAVAVAWVPARPRASVVHSTKDVSVSGIAAAVCVTVHRRRTARKAFEDELGAQPPLGFWDPLGFAKNFDTEDFYHYREAELKHGRVAMYATIGFIVPEYFKWPGYLSPSLNISFEDIPNGLQGLSSVPAEGWIQIMAWCGWYEVVINRPKHKTEPGNYYKGRLGILHNRIIMDKDERQRSLSAEIANGRLAMMAIVGMVAQNGLVGNTGPAMWLPFFNQVQELAQVTQ